MTGVDALIMLALIMLLSMHEWRVEKLRCTYCGQVRDHDDHCPYLGVK